MSGGVKLAYAPQGKYLASVRYLAESEKTCWDSQCREKPNGHLHEALEVSLLAGPRLESEKGSLSAQTGIGMVWGEVVHYTPMEGETRSKSHRLSLPLDLEMMPYLGGHFGLGLTGYGNINPIVNVFGVMASLQLRLF